ncbi:MAG: archease [Candidatus Bathyarchaeota archaeon]|nr:archease [Candidatus Bathyarchaeota archaeon]
MDKRFSYLEEGPSADLTVEAYGLTLGEAFASAALAMFNAMTPLEEVEERVVRTLEVRGDDLGGLLYNFLDELLYVHETELIVLSGVVVVLDEEMLQLTAECSGEPFDLQRHEQGIAIKSVTFHQMKIERGEGGWVIRVVLDT